MVYQMVWLKLSSWLWQQLLANSCYRAAKKVANYRLFFKNPSHKFFQWTNFPSINKCVLENRRKQTLVCDFNGSLLRSKSFFPYFMLVAFEGGSLIRAFLLFLFCPLTWVLDTDRSMKVMIFITFSGLSKKKMECLGRSILPKFYMENLHRQSYQVLSSSGYKVVFSTVPRIMVEEFLKQYLEVDYVVGTELQVVKGYFTGFVAHQGILVRHKALKELFGDKKPDIGIGSSAGNDHLFLSQCKEAYVVNKEDSKAGYSSSVLPREMYPKPLIFHDGRLAFLPTPAATLSMFMWLPIGICLSIFRLLIGVLLPYKIGTPLGAVSGVRVRVKGLSKPSQPHSQKGVMYACSHRTLLDPIFLCTCLQSRVTAVTYSLSNISELLAPIKTVRLVRDRFRDGETMQRLLGEGDLVVCPEGTTCREPYLLRFSSLFAELADDIVPVAINTHVSMFYGTTASGFKCLDPFFFLMNPSPVYTIEFLKKVPREFTCSGGRSSCEVANFVQKQLGDTLGFQCTNLTRRDKYLMLAGNEGLVGENRKL